jgi:hypothetical protein
VNNFRFKDSLIIEKLLSDTNKTDVSQIIGRDKNPRLLVEIDATHSGTIINNRVYPGSHVKNGYKTFISKDKGGVSEYDKPILKHHDLSDDPIGRIIDAKYSQLKFGQEFENDFLAPDPNGSKGSGIVTVKGIISDPDSIKKITDSRYLSVSAGHSSPMLMCSVCADSILDCEHIPGRKYDEEGQLDEDGGNFCWAITGPMTYHELSFVNLPASPAAKLVNFSWTDSKEEWSKKDNIIATQVLGKKEAVRNLVLSDEDGELSLLNNKYTSVKKKTVIAVSPAVADKLKHVISSEKPISEDEALNVRSEKKANTEVLTVEQNLDKAKNLDSKSKEDSTMTVTIDSLQGEVASLKDQLSTAKTEVETIKNQVKAKDELISKLNTDSAEMSKKMSKSLALCLASLRSRLNKVDSELVDTKEKFDKYVDSMSSRTVESLQDSIADLMTELNVKSDTKKPEGEPKSAAEVISGDKVTPTTLSKSKDGKPTDKKENKKSDQPKRAVDRVFES